MDKFLTNHILTILFLKFKKFEPVNESFIRKSLTYTRRPMIIRLIARLPKIFLSQFSITKKIIYILCKKV